MMIDETADGAPLKPVPIFTETSPDDVFGMLHYTGKPKTIAEIDIAVLAEARRLHEAV